MGKDGFTTTYNQKRRRPAKTTRDHRRRKWVAVTYILWSAIILGPVVRLVGDNRYKLDQEWLVVGWSVTGRQIAMIYVRWSATVVRSSYDKHRPVVSIEHQAALIARPSQKAHTPRKDFIKTSSRLHGRGIYNIGRLMEEYSPNVSGPTKSEKP